MTDKGLILAITACPTGIAHTYMAAEKLEEAANRLGYEIRVETHGSIGVENTFSPEELARASAVVVAADKQIEMDRFAGLPTVTTSVSEGIRRPAELIQQAVAAPASAVKQASRPTTAPTGGVGGFIYRALMNGVSHMIPFVVTGGLLIAIALSIGGTPGPKGLEVAEGSFWWIVLQIGSLAFSLMVPILSGYIAYAIADRPGLVPGMVCGLIATTGSLYHSQSGAGFIGGIVTGFLAGFLALGIKRIPVHKYIAPIWPIIVIPVVTTTVVGLAFVYLLGGPISSVFDALTHFLNGMQGGSKLVLGAILGAMVAFDMGGPVNKTAFLFAGGLIAAGNPAPMGMICVAIATPPLGMGVATLVRRHFFTKPEKDAGIAALFMGFFGITEGAIPFAAARPLQVIPANVIGGAVAGALAAMFGVADHVMHGGPIVAALGAVDNPFGFIIALLAGIAVTAVVALVLMSITGSNNPASKAPAAVAESAAVAADKSSAAPSVLDYLSADTLDLNLGQTTRDEALRRLASLGARTGQLTDVDAVVATALQREAEGTTGIGDGIAIPHAKSDGASRPMLAFGRSDSGIDWQSMDGSPAHLVFLIAVPTAQAGDEHLRILAALSRALVSAEFRQRLLDAPTADDVLTVLHDTLDATSDR